MHSSTHTQRVLDLASQKGLLRASDLKAIDAPRVVLTRLTAAGLLEKIGRGLYRLPDFFTRLHGPTKATTLGVGCILIVSMGYHAWWADGLALREVLITLFLFLTAPVSAHLMARAVLRLRPSDRPPPPR